MEVKGLPVYVHRIGGTLCEIRTDSKVLCGECRKVKHGLAFYDWGGREAYACKCIDCFVGGNHNNRREPGEWSTRRFPWLY